MTAMRLYKLRPGIRRFVKGMNKRGANMFEVMVCTFFKQNGYRALLGRVQDIFHPIIAVAKEAFDKWQVFLNYAMCLMLV
jgi:hypothetical protein